MDICILMQWRKDFSKRVHLKLWNSSISEVENAVWAATSAGGADAAVRWDSCRLDFFGTFLIKQKSTEENRDASQFAALAGELFDLLNDQDFIDMLDMYAYLYSNSIGEVNVWYHANISKWQEKFSKYFDKVDYDNFPWTSIKRTLIWPF